MITLVSHIYGFTVHEIQRMTFGQFNAYLSNIEYVVKDSENFGKPPPVELPKLPLVSYAARCSIIIPREIHIDLITNGEPTQ